MSEENNSLNNRPEGSSTFSQRPSRPSASPADASAPRPRATSAAPQASGKKPIVLIIGIVAVIAIVALIVGIAMNILNPYDGASKTGQAPYKTEEEKRAELDKSVEDGMLNISIASLIEFANSSASGTAYIENVPSNKYDMKVKITLDSNGDVVYESGAIKPDSYIETIKLNKQLPAGTYPATATFTAFQSGNGEEVGQAAAKITIVINE